MERKFKKEEGLVGNSKSNGQNSNPLPTPHTPFAIRTLPGFIPNAEVCDATKVGLCAADDYIVKKENQKSTTT